MYNKKNLNIEEAFDLSKNIVCETNEEVMDFFIEKLAYNELNEQATEIIKDLLKDLIGYEILVVKKADLFFKRYLIVEDRKVKMMNGKIVNSKKEILDFFVKDEIVFEYNIQKSDEYRRNNYPKEMFERSYSRMIVKIINEDLEELISKESMQQHFEQEERGIKTKNERKEYRKKLIEEKNNERKTEQMFHFLESTLRRQNEDKNREKKEMSVDNLLDDEIFFKDMKDKGIDFFEEIRKNNLEMLKEITQKKEEKVYIMKAQKVYEKPSSFQTKQQEVDYYLDELNTIISMQKALGESEESKVEKEKIISKLKELS